MVDSQRDTLASSPLLDTKLYIPKRRTNGVSRPRLVERLKQGAQRTLTLISAPAGFGKTTLLTEWLSSTSPDQLAVGWVSLDERDNDPTLFWAYFVTGLMKALPSLGDQAISSLFSPQPPPTEVILTSLINDINEIDGDVALILDDFHVIEDKSIQQDITFFIEHLPPQMHLILASRTDLPLPLGRLRGRGELTEIRSADLRFEPDEAIVFFNEVMGHNLSSSDVATLEARTEGWIAGLQLAALSMQGRDNVSEFINSFAGDDRYIADFLVEEVLQRQPAAISEFLLQTSILDRLNGSLCDAVTTGMNGNTVLETLERGNLFVIPLDDKRHWYRYHHLFGEVLRSRLQQERPEQLPLVHRRASEWFEQHGFTEDGIRHALFAEDYERAIYLIEKNAQAMFISGQGSTLFKWVASLPEPLIKTRPLISMWSAWSAMEAGKLELTETHLRNAEELYTLYTKEGAETENLTDRISTIVNEEEFKNLPGTIAAARASLAQASGDVNNAIIHARRALELLPEDDLLWRGGATAILGLSSWTVGNLEEAHEVFSSGLALIKKIGNINFEIAGTHVLSDIRNAQGRLRDAEETYRRSMQLTETWDGPVIRGTGDLHLGLSDLALERGNLEEAIQFLQSGMELGEHASLTENLYRWRLTRARIEELRGKYDEALTLIDEAEKRYHRDPVPLVRSFEAIRIRVWLKQQRLGDALAWMNKQHIPTEDELAYLQEYTHVTMARVLLAQYKSEEDIELFEQAADLLERLLKAAQEGGRMGSTIELLILKALLLQANNQVPESLFPLELAIQHAEPEQFVKMFVDEGTEMRELLRYAAAGGIGGAYTRHLLSFFDKPAPASANTTSALDQSLTARELEVLRLIAAGLKNQEIADQLFISLSTVKRHIANTYIKLDVNSRTEAVARANEHGVI